MRIRKGRGTVYDQPLSLSQKTSTSTLRLRFVLLSRVERALVALRTHTQQSTIEIQARIYPLHPSTCVSRTQTTHPQASPKRTKQSSVAFKPDVARMASHLSTSPSYTLPKSQTVHPSLCPHLLHAEANSARMEFSFRRGPYEEQPPRRHPRDLHLPRRTDQQRVV